MDTGRLLKMEALHFFCLFDNKKNEYTNRISSILSNNKVTLDW